VPRDDDSVSSNVETAVTLMMRGVAKKDTPSGAWGELMGAMAERFG